jgi:hypothetical protein
MLGAMKLAISLALVMFAACTTGQLPPAATPADPVPVYMPPPAPDDSAQQQQQQQQSEQIEQAINQTSQQIMAP